MSVCVIPVARAVEYSPASMVFKITTTVCHVIKLQLQEFPSQIKQMKHQSEGVDRSPGLA